MSIKKLKLSSLKFRNYDNKIWKILSNELIRQKNCINLIASENYASEEVMKIQGTIFTNKYAEGYSSNRYYEGCEYVDCIEDLAIERAKKLFNADFANVQPHSGSQANAAVYLALLNPGDTILSMSLKYGGHLSHGFSLNFSGKFYKSVFYSLNKETYELDYDEIEFQAKKYNPKIIIGGFSSYSGLLNWKKLREIADLVDAYLLADISHVAGLVVAGLYPSPIDYAHVVTTTTHKTLSGPRGGLIIAKGGSASFYRKLNASVFPGIQGGPLMHVIAAKAISFRDAMSSNFRFYQAQVLKNSKKMFNTFQARGFKMLSKNISNHLFLIDLCNKNITGKDFSSLLRKSNIIVNKNFIPNDLRSSFETSGIRIGSQAITKRGFRESESSKVANWICDILERKNDFFFLKKIKFKVLRLCKKFPIY